MHPPYDTNLCLFVQKSPKAQIIKFYIVRIIQIQQVIFKNIRKKEKKKKRMKKAGNKINM